MVDTTLAIAEFPTILENHSTRSNSAKLESILRGIERVQTQNPAAYSKGAIEKHLRKRSRVLKRLVDDYFVAAISQEFPLLSDELFGLQRYITLIKEDGKLHIVRDDTEKAIRPPLSLTRPIKPSEPSYHYSFRELEERLSENRVRIRLVKDESVYEKKMKRHNERMKRHEKKLRAFNEEQERTRNTAVVKVPLFAYTPLFVGDHSTKLGEFPMGKEERVYVDNDGDRWFEKREKTGVLRAKLPGHINQELKGSAMGALSHYFGVLSTMTSDTAVGEALYTEGDFQPEIGAIWIPTPESLGVTVGETVTKIKDDDPAMILTARNKRYLVKTWMVDDEEPSEHYLREFSVGDLKDKVRRGR